MAILGQEKLPSRDGRVRTEGASRDSESGFGSSSPSGSSSSSRQKSPVKRKQMIINASSSSSSSSSSGSYSESESESESDDNVKGSTSYDNHITAPWIATDFVGRLAKKSAMSPAASSEGIESVKSGRIRNFRRSPTASLHTIASESAAEREGSPDNVNSEWDWGSVDPDSDRGEVERKKDEETGDKKQKCDMDEDDTEAGVRAPDQQIHEKAEEISDVGGYEAELDDGEDTALPRCLTDKSYDKIRHLSVRSSATRSLSQLPTPEASETDFAPRTAARALFAQSASQQYKAAIQKREREINSRSKGRQRGAQVNGFTQEYVELLNTEIRSASSRKIYGVIDNARMRAGSFVVGSWWTQDEKEVFFDHLAVLGRDNVGGISKAVGTKTVIECRAYIDMLHQGHIGTQDWVGSRSRDTVGLKEIPAAVELSDNCIEALDRQAQLLEDRKTRDTQRLEKDHWGGFWLLDSAMGQHISNVYKSGGVDNIHDIAPEAELLNVNKMLELSERIFMNGPGDSNFRAISQSEEPPSMYYTAFADIHKLVVAVTRRLLQTTLFMAESRLRSTENTIFAPKPFVRSDDVKAAADCLNMPSNSKGYWAKIPRRMGIIVVEHKLNMNYKNPITMDLDEVEKQLSRTVRKKLRSEDRKQSRKLEDESSVSTHQEDTDGKEKIPENENSRGNSDPEMSLFDYDDNDSDRVVAADGYLSTAQLRREERVKIAEEKEDRYLETLDFKHSFKAEKELWKIMGIEGDDSESRNNAISDNFDEDGFTTDDEKSLQRRSRSPGRPRREARLEKRSRHVLDWRASVEYHAPWEQAKRTRLEWEEGDYLDYQAQAARELVENPPRKRRKTKNQPAAALPREQRTRRQQGVAPGFVSTIEAVPLGNEEESIDQTAEAAMAYAQEEEDDSDEYQGEDGVCSV